MYMQSTKSIPMESDMAYVYSYESLKGWDYTPVVNGSVYQVVDSIISSSILCKCKLDRIMMNTNWTDPCCWC